MDNLLEAYVKGIDDKGNTVDSVWTSAESISDLATTCATMDAKHPRRIVRFLIDVAVPNSYTFGANA